jgi:RimJ/RimL family protein N-acetyltransferase
MLRYVYGHDDAVAKFVAALIPHIDARGFPVAKSAIGVIDDEGRLIAGLVYTNWNSRAGTMDISGAALPGTNWLTRETILRGLAYPFEQCGCQMVVMRVLADNERLLRQLATSGFMFVKVPRLYGRDKDGVMCLLTDDVWQSNPILRRARGVKPDQPHPLDIPEFLDRRREAA